MYIVQFKDCIDSGNMLGAILAAQNLDLNITYEHILDSTPLMYAGYKGDVEVMSALIAIGSNVNTRDNGGCTALYYSQRSVKRCPDTIDVLLQAGADVNKMNLHGAGALHFSCLHGDDKIVTLLINHGADINVQNVGNQTSPLHMACTGGHIGIVKNLISAGADVNTIDKEGKTPLDIAVERKYTEIIEILRKGVVDSVS